jgi:hypothetical protein
LPIAWDSPERSRTTIHSVSGPGRRQGNTPLWSTAFSGLPFPRKTLANGLIIQRSACTGTRIFYSNRPELR